MINLDNHNFDDEEYKVVLDSIAYKYRNYKKIIDKVTESVRCPNCKSTVDKIEIGQTAIEHCNYCDTGFTAIKLGNMVHLLLIN